jgi:dolichol kinase
MATHDPAGGDGALAELFSFRLDDNLTIPLAVAAAVTRMGGEGTG